MKIVLYEGIRRPATGRAIRIGARVEPTDPDPYTGFVRGSHAHGAEEISSPELTKLISEAGCGGEVLIARRGEPVARVGLC